MKHLIPAMCLLVGCVQGAFGDDALPATGIIGTLQPNQWTEIRPVYKAPAIGGKADALSWNKLVYDSIGRRIINIDGWRVPEAGINCGIYANSLTALDLSKNEIDVLSVFNWNRGKGGSGPTVALPDNAGNPTPVPRHPYGNVAFVPSENAVYLSAGANRSAPKPDGVKTGKGVHPNDTWRFDLAAGKWTPIEGPQPPESVSDSMTYVPDIKRIVRWVSKTRSIWLLDLDSGDWQEQPTTGGPALGLRTAMTYDSKRKQVLLFGGGEPGRKFNEPGGQLWALSVENFSWERLPDGPPASGAGWTYAPKYDLVLCQRDSGAKSSKAAEFWAYLPGKRTWHQLEFEGPVPPKLYHTIAYDEAHDLFVCQSRPLNWYVMQLDPDTLKGMPSVGTTKVNP